MQRTELPTGPWQDIALDLMGPWQDIALDLMGPWQDIALDLMGPWQDIALDLMGPWQDIALDLMGPWQDIALDLMGPLPTRESLLVVVDYYSRYFDVEIMQSNTTEKITNALIPILTRHGYPFSPEIIITDINSNRKNSKRSYSNTGSKIEHPLRYGHKPMARWNVKTDTWNGRGGNEN